MRSRRCNTIRHLAEVCIRGNCGAVIVINNSVTVGSTVGNVVASSIRGLDRVSFNVVTGKVKGSFTSF